MFDKFVNLLFAYFAFNIICSNITYIYRVGYFREWEIIIKNIARTSETKP